MEVEHSQKVSEASFQEYLNDSDLHNNFLKRDRKTTSEGEYTVYICIFGKKSGYKVCPSKVKIV